MACQLTRRGYHIALLRILVVNLPMNPREPSVRGGLIVVIVARAGTTSTPAGVLLYGGATPIVRNSVDIVYVKYTASLGASGLPDLLKKVITLFLIHCFI